MEEHPMNYISKPGKSYSVKCNLALSRQEWYQIKKKRSDCQILKNGVKLPEISWNPFFKILLLSFCTFFQVVTNNRAILSAIQAKVHISRMESHALSSGQVEVTKTET